MCWQGYFKRVFEFVFHSGARGCSKVYAGGMLAPLACMAFYLCCSYCNPVIWLLKKNALVLAIAPKKWYTVENGSDTSLNVTK